MQSSRRRGVRAVTLAIVAAAAAMAVAAGTRAGGSATLTIQVAPGTISAGEPALAIGTFTNGGSSALPHVVVTFTFPIEVDVTAPGCAPSTGMTGVVSCPVGKIAAGTTTSTPISFLTPGATSAFQASGKATWDAATRSRGNDAEQQGAVAATSAPVKIFAAGDPTHKGTCATGSGSLDAELNGQGTELPTLPVADSSLGFPCTPLAVAVEARPSGSTFGTDIAIVDVPKLQQAATVLLTFRDEELPGSVANPNPLREIPNPADLNPATFIVVPLCQDGGTAIPSGFDSCIVSVVPDDPDGDADAGVITLLVQGGGLDDPGFVG